MKLTNYDFIFPLGEACFTAGLMKKLHLRTMSCPFDWMFGASFEDRFQIFLDDFKNFINKEDLKFSETYTEGKISHNSYLNNRNKIYFNHDFPPNVDLEISYPQVKEKYDKRIKNTLDKIKKSKKVLLLYIDLPGTQRKLDDDEKLIDLMQEASKKYPDTTFHILYIKHNEQLKDGETIFKALNDSVFTAECYNKSRDPNALSWWGNTRNVKKIVSRVKLKNQFYHTLISLYRQAVLKINQVRIDNEK